MKYVSILTHNFVDGYSGNYTRFFGGGLERYLYDLCKLIQELGWTPEVHQMSYYQAFHTELEGIEIIGHTYRMDQITEAFSAMADHARGPLIYSSFIWHPIEYAPGSLGICHGINWDQPSLPLEEKNTVMHAIRNALEKLNKIVTVDSHFLTYCRSVCQYTETAKIELIPNSVDTYEYTPSHEIAFSEVGSKLMRILYPRRLSYERGLITMMLLADQLLEQYPKIEIEFAGELVKHSAMGETFAAWQSFHPHRDRIIQNSYSFKDMVHAYQSAEIAVIPTVFSEGTSLSCLEAMSCGLSIVATNVGGLNDLIIDRWNGLKVHPTEEDLYQAIRELVENEPLRALLGERARNTACAFDRSIWKRKWRRVLEDFLK